ncbi:MAG: transcription repressor NadR [Clostridia bacterium]|nr:transcription repressor NadR [Clostridia bacterium]
MRVFDRRRELLHLLQVTKQPISAGKFSELFGVSRQIIVQDISALKSEHPEILSTPRGYVFDQPAKSERVVKVYHTDEQTEDELSTIVALGGAVQTVFVYHRVYGKIEAVIDIENKTHIADYVHALSGNSRPLKNITGGYHYHLIAADSSETLDRIAEALKQKGYLVE